MLAGSDTSNEQIIINKYSNIFLSNMYKFIYCLIHSQSPKILLEGCKNYSFHYMNVIEFSRLIYNLIVKTSSNVCWRKKIEPNYLFCRLIWNIFLNVGRIIIFWNKMSSDSMLQYPTKNFYLSVSLLLPNSHCIILSVNAG